MQREPEQRRAPPPIALAVTRDVERLLHPLGLGEIADALSGDPRIARVDRGCRIQRGDELHSSLADPCRLLRRRRLVLVVPVAEAPDLLVTRPVRAAFRLDDWKAHATHPLESDLCL